MLLCYYVYINRSSTIAHSAVLYATIDICGTYI